MNKLKAFFCENNINVLLNHLTVLYLFFITFIPHSRTTDALWFIMIALVILRKNYLYYLKKAISHPITKPFLALYLFFLLWSFSPINKAFTLHTLEYLRYLLYPLFFFSFIDRRFFSRFIAALLIGTMLSEVLSYLMQFDIIPWGLRFEHIHFPWNSEGRFKTIYIYSAIRGEPAPFFEHSLYSILIATMANIILYRFLFVSLNKKEKIIEFFFFITMSINLFFIGGRTGYLLYFVLLFFLFLSLVKQKYSKKTVLSIFTVPIAILVLMYYNGGLFQQRVNQTFHIVSTMIETEKLPLNSSIGQRLHMALSSLKIIQNNFFTGVGTGNQLTLLRKDPQNIHSDIQFVHDIHNQYLNITMQLGIFGLLFYLYSLFNVYQFQALNQQRNYIKNMTVIAMFFSGFLATFWWFLHVFFMMLIIISSANQKIIHPYQFTITLKQIIQYLGFAIFIYLYGILQ